MTASPDPQFFVLPLEQGRRLRLFGELDLSTVGDLLEALGTLPDDADVLDLAALSFMDASGLHALEQYAQETRNGAGPLVLENVPAHVRRLFEITGADANPDIELRSGSVGG
jgi:anti-anti-sigma factor